MLDGDVSAVKCRKGSGLKWGLANTRNVAGPSEKDLEGQYEMESELGPAGNTFLHISYGSCVFLKSLKTKGALWNSPVTSCSWGL